MDTDLGGADIAFVLCVPSWELCSYICSQKPECKFWTWVDEQYRLNQAIIHKCHLKNKDLGRAATAGLVSGASGCKPCKEKSSCHI